MYIWRIITAHTNNRYFYLQWNITEIQLFLSTWWEKCQITFHNQKVASSSVIRNCQQDVRHSLNWDKNVKIHISPDCELWQVLPRANSDWGTTTNRNIRCWFSTHRLSIYTALRNAHPFMFDYREGDSFSKAFKNETVDLIKCQNSKAFLAGTEYRVPSIPKYYAPFVLLLWRSCCVSCLGFYTIT